MNRDCPVSERILDSTAPRPWCAINRPRKRQGLRRRGGAARGPLAATTGLGFAGFFFPLLKPVLGMGGNPAIRQQGFQGGSIVGSDRREATHGDQDRGGFAALDARYGVAAPGVPPPCTSLSMQR